MNNITIHYVIPGILSVGHSVT